MDLDPVPSMRLVLVAVLSFTLFACDKSGLHDHGRASDTLSACGMPTTTWVRSLANGTEIFVIGGVTPGAPQEPACFVRAIVEPDSSVFMETGAYVVDDQGLGEVVIDTEYTFMLEADITPISRRGARRDNLDPVRTERLVLTRTPTHLEVDAFGGLRRMTALPEVIDRLDPTTQSGVEDIFRLANFPFFMSQVRIEGFGATGITQYTEASTFVGIASGSYRIGVTPMRLRVVVDLTYDQLRDVSDIVVDGNQHTNTGFDGSGRSTDMLTYRFIDSSGDTLVAEVRFDVEIRSGVAAAGLYYVTVGGQTFEVNYSLQNDVHIRNLLAVGE